MPYAPDRLVFAPLASFRSSRSGLGRPSEQLDAYLCGQSFAGDTIYSLAQAYRPSAERLRAEQLLVITISEVQVARTHGEGTEEEESDGGEAEEVVENPAYISGHGGPLRIAPLGVINQKYFLAQFPNVAGAWSTGAYIESLGFNRQHAFFHRAQYVVHRVTQTMRHIQRDLLSRKIMVKALAGKIYLS